MKEQIPFNENDLIAGLGEALSHAEELRKTEEDLKAGRVTAVDWDEAKKALRKRFE